jgi:CHAD domain-containing protein
MNNPLLVDHQSDEQPAAPRVVDFADKVLAGRFKRLRRAMKAARDGDLPALHNVRLEAKKMRYTAEFFSGLYKRRRVKPALRRLSRVQDALGSLNDARTGDRLLEELRVRAALEGALGKPMTERAAGIVTGWQAAAIEQSIAAYRARRKALRRLEPFWS